MPRGGAPQRPPATAATPPAPPPPDDEIIGPTAKRIVHPTAHFSGLDKITGRIINFPGGDRRDLQFGALQLTTRACYTRPAEEAANTDAFVEVDEVTLQGEVKRTSTGWMFASSPGLHVVEHPIYDLWLTDCRGGAQVAEGAPQAPPAAQPQPKAQPKQKQISAAAQAAAAATAASAAAPLDADYVKVRARDQGRGFHKSRLFRRAWAMPQSALSPEGDVGGFSPFSKSELPRQVLMPPQNTPQP